MESGASSGTAVPPIDTANWRRILHALYKLISVVLYLLDFGSNVYTAIQYYRFDYGGVSFEGISRGAKGYSIGRNHGIFISMVTVMAVGHISWAIVFKLVNFPRERHPLVLAYFLPFVQLQRVLCSLFNRSPKGNSRSPTAQEKKEESRVEALYGIMSATTDGGPLFLLQYLGLAEYTLEWYLNYDWTPPVLFTVSLCLSAASATWNVTRAIGFLVPFLSKRLALAAGAFTLSALMVRCTTLVSLALILAVSIDHAEHVLQSGIMLGVYVLLISLVPFIGNFFLIWEGSSKFDRRTLANSTLRAVGFTYVSLSFRPLYPLVSAAQTNKRLGVTTKRFQCRLFFYVACRLVLETSIMAFLVAKHWSPCLSREILEDYHNDVEFPADRFWFCPMIPCSLYKVALAVGLGVGVLSTAAFMMFLKQVRAGAHLQNGELASASDAAYESPDAAYESLGISVDVVICCSSLSCFC